MNLVASSLIALGAVALVAYAGGTRSDSVVKVKAEAVEAPPGKAVVLVHLDIKPGWHLYANPVGNEDLASGQVVVKAAGKNPPKAVKIEYPKGKEKEDKTIGSYRVYTDKVSIRAIVDRVAGDANPLEFSVRLQACSGQTCLLPSTVRVSVP